MSLPMQDAAAGHWVQARTATRHIADVEPDRPNGG